MINAPGVYYQILRNNAPISDAEMLHLVSVSVKDSYIEGMVQTCTLQFDLSSNTGANPDSDVNENFDILYTYMFSQSDKYDIYLGTSEQDSAYMMTGGVYNVEVDFAENGLISFTVTINNSIFVDPSMVQDEASPKKYHKGMTLWDIINDVCNSRGVQVFADQQTVASLTQIGLPDDIIRPNAQTSVSFLQELAEEYGLYMGQQRDGIHVSKPDLKKPPQLYFKYRPVDPNYSGGLILSFRPELMRQGFYSADAIHDNPFSGTDGTATAGPPLASQSGSQSTTPDQHYLTRDQEKDNAVNKLKITPRQLNAITPVFEPGRNPLQVIREATKIATPANPSPLGLNL
jgi:hypothetical protein